MFEIFPILTVSIVSNLGMSEKSTSYKPSRSSKSRKFQRWEPYPKSWYCTQCDTHVPDRPYHIELHHKGMKHMQIVNSLSKLYLLFFINNLTITIMCNFFLPFYVRFLFAILCAIVIKQSFYQNWINWINNTLNHSAQNNYIDAHYVQKNFISIILLHIYIQHSIHNIEVKIVAQLN